MTALAKEEAFSCWTTQLTTPNKSMGNVCRTHTLTNIASKKMLVKTEKVVSSPNKASR